MDYTRNLTNPPYSKSAFHIAYFLESKNRQPVIRIICGRYAWEQAKQHQEFGPTVCLPPGHRFKSYRWDITANRLACLWITDDIFSNTAIDDFARHLLIDYRAIEVYSVRWTCPLETPKIYRREVPAYGRAA